MTDPANNDLSAGYMDHRIMLASVSAGDELLSRFAPSAATKAETPGAAATPATLPNQVADAALSDTGSQASIVGRVAKDVGIGMVEIPRSVVKGVRDAYQNTIDVANEFGGWVEDKLNLPVLHVGSDGISVQSHEEALNYPRLADKAKLPDINAPKTVTGGIIKGITQFLVGMKGAGKVLDVAGIPESVGALGYSRSALQGFIANFAAFDSHQQRLSNLVEKFPALQNPVTKFLSSTPGDNAAEGRFKNALEGLGLGLITDGFFKGVKLLRDASIAKKAAQGADEAASAAEIAAKPPELPPDAFKDLGSEAPNAPLVKLQRSNATLTDVTDAMGAGGAPQTAASSAAGRASEPQKAFINFARIDAPEDVQRVMQKLADIGSPAKDSAKASVRGFEQVKLDAAHQDAWDILVNRRAGQPLGDAESLAARELWAATTQKVTQLAEAAATSPSEANLFAFRKMLDVHDMVQREVLGARASTARALASWRIPAGGPAERMRNVSDVLNATGGSEVSRELAARVAALGKAGMISEMGAVAEKGAYATSRDAVLEAWINGLLSNPTTHAANTISNSSVVFLRMGERKVASKISSLLGSDEGVAAGEATSQWFGMMQGLKDNFRYYGKLGRAFLNEDVEGFQAARAEKPVQQLGISGTKLEHPPSISSDAFNISSSSWLGRTADYGGMAIRTPGKVLQLSDDFFKTLGYRMEVSAQALRQATSEVHAGNITEDGLKSRVAELIANPPENIRLAAIDSATYQTFTNAPGLLARSIGKLTNHYPALKVILPFTRTPANIMKFTFERTPLAPLMSQVRANIAAGGARRDLALAQIAVGTGAMMTFADMTMNGQVSGRGPVEKGQKQAMSREGWQPYSIKLGDRWVSYNRLDPVGSLIGMSADATEMLMQAQHDALDDADTEKLAVAGALAFAGNITNKTYLSGLSSAIEALNDPQRAAESWTQRLAGSIIPSGVAQIERLDDPTVREVYSMMDAIRARTPGLSDSLAPRLDMWGDPLKTDSGLGKPFDAISPVSTRNPTPEPIDKEIERIDSNVAMPSRRTSFNGATIDLSQYPKAYSRYVELAGNELKHPAWGLGAKDLLNKIVTDQHPLSAIYNLKSDGPEGGKDLFIRDIVNQYREMARRQLLTEFPDLNRKVEEIQAHQRELKMPVLN